MAEIRNQNREEGIVNCRKNHGRIWSKVMKVGQDLQWLTGGRKVKDGTCSEYDWDFLEIIS